MNTCPPVQPCFCPTADLPLSLQMVSQGGPGTVIVVPIFGSQPFSASIVLNPTLPITLLPLIASVQILNGNELTITTVAPDIAETLGTYNAQIQVCNACGTLTIDLSIEVVADLNPVVTNCLLAQALWVPEAREPTVGDTLLAFTPAGCRALLPPTVDVCATLQGFPGAVPADIDTVFGQKAGACVEFTILDIIALVDVCAALNTFNPGAPLSPVDRLIALQGATCVTTTVAELTAAVDVCTLLQNLPNAVVQPTAVFYGQQGGQCFEFAVADLLALAVPPCPLLATCDGSCIAPAYSFASQPTSGMWMNGAILTLSANNCADTIEIGASINITATTAFTMSNAAGALLSASSVGNVNLSAAPARTTTVSGGNGNSLQLLGSGVALLEAGPNQNTIVNAGTNGVAQLRSPSTSSIIAVNDLTGQILLNQPASGSNISVAVGVGPTINAGPGLGVLLTSNASSFGLALTASGELEVNGTPGGAGAVLTSGGPGFPPTWSAPSASVPLNDVQDATGSATRNHGVNVIDWQFDVFNANALIFRDASDERFRLGPFTFLTGRRGDGEASLNALSAGGAVQSFVRVASHPTQPSATLSATFVASSASIDVRPVGIQLSASDGNNGILYITDRNTFRTSAARGQFMVGLYSSLFASGNLLRVDGTANGGTPVLAAEGASDADVSIQLTPKGAGTVLTPSFTVTADNSYKATGQTSGAGASLGTLTNAPSAGDPAFWLRVVINGINHFIPAWT